MLPVSYIPLCKSSVSVLRTYSLQNVLAVCVAGVVIKSCVM